MKQKNLLNFLGIIACLLLASPAAGDDHNSEGAWNDKAATKSDGKTVSFHATVRSAGDHTISVDVNQTISTGRVSHGILERTSYLYYQVWNEKEQSWGSEIPICFYGSFDRAGCHDDVFPEILTVPDWVFQEGWLAITKPADDEKIVGKCTVTNSWRSRYDATIRWGWKGIGTVNSAANGFMSHALKYDTEGNERAYNTSYYIDIDWEMPSCLAGRLIKVGIHRAQYANGTHGAYVYEDGTECRGINDYTRLLQLIAQGVIKWTTCVTFEESEYIPFDILPRKVFKEDLTIAFTPEPAEYNGLKKVAMSCPIVDTKIYYTTDGSDPTTSSAEYTEPILIEATTTIKAMAVFKSKTPSFVLNDKPYINYFKETTGNIVSATYTINPLEYVDLGLPSGLLWATHNVGAKTPEEYGNYYAWGDPRNKTNYSWGTYPYGNSVNNCTKYRKDNRWILEPKDDMAAMNWGARWRVPTKANFKELFTYCDTAHTTMQGVFGILLTSKANGESLFLPAAGNMDGTSLDHAGEGLYYWSSSVVDMVYGNVFWLQTSPNWNAFSGYRYCGFSVRPVIDPNQPVREFVFIEGTAKKTEYSVGDKFDVTGMEVRFVPKESSAEKVTEGVTWTVQPAVIYSGCTSVTVTASYNGMTTDPVQVAVTTNGLPVDLGLSVQWSSFNIGSATFMGYGDYYPWDENLDKYIESMFGKGWRLPTEAEVKELQDTTKCTWQWFPAGNAENGGVAGYRVISKANNNFIFLPATGCQSGSNTVGGGSVGNYWTSNTAASGSADVYYMCFDMYDQCIGNDNRSNGRVIRAVKK